MADISCSQATTSMNTPNSQYSAKCSPATAKWITAVARLRMARQYAATLSLDTSGPGPGWATVGWSAPGSTGPPTLFITPVSCAAGPAGAMTRTRPARFLCGSFHHRPDA